MKKYVIIALAVVVMGLGVLYVYLGGLNSIEYTVENVNNYHLVGRMFQGKADAKEIEDYFFEAKDFAIGGTIDGELTILHYNDTTLAKKEIKLFIGVLLNNAADTLDLPAGYALVKVPAQKTIRATILANNAVIPGPETSIIYNWKIPFWNGDGDWYAREELSFPQLLIHLFLL